MHHRFTVAGHHYESRPLGGESGYLLLLQWIALVGPGASGALASLAGDLEALQGFGSADKEGRAKLRAKLVAKGSEVLSTHGPALFAMLARPEAGALVSGLLDHLHSRDGEGYGPGSAALWWGGNPWEPLQVAVEVARANRFFEPPGMPGGKPEQGKPAS